MNVKKIGTTLLIISLSGALAFTLYKQNKTLKQMNVLLSYVQAPESMTNTREHFNDQYQPPPPGSYTEPELDTFIQPRRNKKVRKKKKVSFNDDNDRFVVNQNLEDSLFGDDTVSTS